MAYNITDLLFKLSQNRRPTSQSKRLLEEVAGFAQIIVGQQVWQEDLNADPSVAVTVGNVVLDTDLVLTTDPTTPTGEENSIWLAGNVDYIPPNVIPGDLGYTTTIKDNAGTIIPDGKQDEYGLLFIHIFGVLLVQDPTGFAGEFTFPPKITSYRYVGTKGVGAGALSNVDGGTFFDGFPPISGQPVIDGGTF